MRRKTYAYNSIIFGFLLGFLVYATSKSTALAVLTGIGVSVVGFFIIRLIENAVYKGVNKASDKIIEVYRRQKEQKGMENGSFIKPGAAQTPDGAAQFLQKAESSNGKASYCPVCGAKIQADAGFCQTCGKPLGF